MISRVVNSSFASHNPFSPTGGSSPYTKSDYVHEAVVVDVITNDAHPEYATDGYNIGAIKFRMLKGDMYKDTARLHWAMPMEANLSEYPLLNEIVLIVPALNRFVYGRKLNTSSRITSQAMFGINEEMSLPPSSADKSVGYRKSVGTPVQPSQDTDVLGRYFKNLPKLYRLKHDEGDIVFEGRSGQSIRLGAAWNTEKTLFNSTGKDQAPNLLMRVGPNPQATPTTNTPYGLVLEDINKDASSLWMVSDQLVDLTYSTAASPVHLKSIDDFPTRLTGNQIVMNTDRFVVNAKIDKIMGFSPLGIHWTTSRDFTVDAGQDYVSLIVRDQKVEIQQDRTYKIARDDIATLGRDETYTVGRDKTHTIGNNTVYKSGGFLTSTAGSYHAFVSPTVYLGMNGDKSQPVPKGMTLAEFLGKFIDAHLQNASTHVITKTGPGQLSPAIVAALIKLKADVSKGAKASFNSSTVFTK